MCKDTLVNVLKVVLSWNFFLRIYCQAAEPEDLISVPKTEMTKGDYQLHFYKLAFDLYTVVMKQVCIYTHSKLLIWQG